MFCKRCGKPINGFQCVSCGVGYPEHGATVLSEEFFSYRVPKDDADVEPFVPSDVPPAQRLATRILDAIRRPAVYIPALLTALVVVFGSIHLIPSSPNTGDAARESGNPAAVMQTQNSLDQAERDVATDPTGMGDIRTGYALGSGFTTPTMITPIQKSMPTLWPTPSSNPSSTPSSNPSSTPWPTPSSIPSSNPSSTPTPPLAPVERFAVVTLKNPSSYVYLREAPNISAKKLAEITHGVTIQVLSEGENWWEVLYGTQTGYVFAPYLRILEAAPTATPVAVKPGVTPKPSGVLDDRVPRAYD